MNVNDLERAKSLLDKATALENQLYQLGEIKKHFTDPESKNSLKVDITATIRDPLSMDGARQHMGGVSIDLETLQAVIEHLFATHMGMVAALQSMGVDTSEMVARVREHAS